MRVILDTNIIISGLISEQGAPAQLLNAWTDKVFALVTSTQQLEEITAVTRRPVVKALITPSNAGRFINDLHRFATVLEQLPVVDRSSDPNDNFLLAMTEASLVNYLVTGDKRGLLDLKQHGPTHIVTAIDMLRTLGFETVKTSSPR